jgi:hypothetical protein
METRKHKEQPRIVPMRGNEVEIMFGDSSVRELEDKHTAIGQELSRISIALQSEEDPIELESLRDRIQELRDEMRDLSRVIRKEQKKFGEQRGPVVM